MIGSLGIFQHADLFKVTEQPPGLALLQLLGDLDVDPLPVP